jgi:hypothetical protein
VRPCLGRSYESRAVSNSAAVQGRYREFEALLAVSRSGRSDSSARLLRANPRIFDRVDAGRADVLEDLLIEALHNNEQGKAWTS